MLRFTFLMLCGCFVQTTFIISLKRSTFLPFRSAKMGHEADYPIWFGLRAPVRKGKKAYLVGGAIDDLFKPGNKRSKAEPEVVPVELDGLGIRDLAPLPDKRLLVVAGAPDGPEVTFQLFVVDPAKEKVTPIGPLSAVTQPVNGKTETGKAEGVTVLDMAGDKAQIVVLFDGLPNGAPHLANIAIPPRNMSR